MAAGPAPARLHRGAARRLVHARRPRRPVRRPHRAEDEGGAPPRLRRRALHRRGVLPLQARERARLRRRGDRDPAPGDGGRARQARRDLRGLQGPDGRLLPLEPGPELAGRAPHRLPGLRRRRADGDRAPDARPPELRVRRGRRGGVPRVPRAARQAAALRARPQRPQLDRPRPAAPGEPTLRGGPQRALARGADDHHSGRHPASPASSRRTASRRTTPQHSGRTNARSATWHGRSSSASSATRRRERRPSPAGSCACSARTTSRTSAPTTTTATTAGSARSGTSRRCTPSATTSTSWASTSATCARATGS